MLVIMHRNRTSPAGRFGSRPHASWRARVAVLAVLALGFATFAWAAHSHAADGTQGDARDQICALCLHFERLGTTPQVVLLAAMLLVAIASLALTTLPLPVQIAPHAYRARAPPVSLR